MHGKPGTEEHLDIPVLETPAADMVNDQLLEELDIPILTTPADTEAPKDDHKPI